MAKKVVDTTATSGVSDRAEVTKMTSIKPQAPHEASGTWISRHKIWTAVLVLLVLAVATGAVLCTIY